MSQSFQSALLRGMLVLASGAILLLAAAAFWFTHQLSQDFVATRLRQTLVQVEQRVRQLTQDAVRFREVAQRHLNPDVPLAPQFTSLMTGLADTFDLHPSVSYVGLGVEATGEYSMLQRTPGSGVTRNREYGRLPNGSREIRDFQIKGGDRQLLRRTAWDGYDPRQRLFWQAARTAGRAVWTDSYAFWGGNENGQVPGITYAAPLYNTRSNLVGVLDVDFDLFDLSAFLSRVGSATEGYCFIVEERAGSRLVVAHPRPAQILDEQTRLFPTNALSVADPVARAVLASAQEFPPAFTPQPGAPRLVRAAGAAYYWAAVRFDQTTLPRWAVVTVLPRAIVLRQTRSVYLCLALAALFLLGLSATLAHRVARHVAGPLHDLERQITQQTAQLVPMPVKLSGATELRALGAAFNQLLSGLDQQRQQLLAANHQLQLEIRQRETAEAALRDSQEKFQKAFNNSPDAIAIVRQEGGQYLEVNDTFCRLFGYTRDEALKMSSVELLYERPADRAAVLEIVSRTGHLRDHEMRTRRKGGTVFEASLSIEPVTIRGEPCLIGIVRDITERIAAAAELKRHRDHLEELVHERTGELSRINLILATQVHERQQIEVELREANDRLRELDRLKSEFLATMSHELRTPLNSIIGFTGILRQRLPGPLTPEQDKQLGMVQGSARHLLALINDLLDLSRIESGKMELHSSSFPVSAVVDEVHKTLEPMANLKQLTLRTEMDAPEIEAHTDRKKLYQILLNLVNNAVKFTHAGEVCLRVCTAPDKLIFCVRDTGIGIRAEHMPLLFEAFRQVDGSARRVYEGTGLGLYLCRKLAGLLGGEISAQSEFGKGSEFTVTLPVMQTAPSPHEQHPVSRG